MELYEVKRKIVEETKKGSWQNMTWQKVLELRKRGIDTTGIEIIKVSQGIVKFGCEYDNLKDTKEKRESGELPQDNQGLNGLEWELYPYLLKNSRNNETYVRCSLQKNSKIKTCYYMNGKEITKEEAEVYATAKNFGNKNGEKPSIININIKNIIEIKEKNKQAV